MEQRKGKISILMVGLFVLLALGVVFYFMENYETVYYTQIDNTKIQNLSALEDMKYEYTLEAYSKSGRKKAIKFKTSRELKEDAYLMLEVRSLGVHSWKEVQYQELPEKVKVHYQK